MEQLPIRARLEEYYYSTIMPNLAILSYDHNSPDASLEALEANSEWNYSVGDKPLEKLYTTPVAKLPTDPLNVITQNLLTTELQNVGMPKKGRRYKQKLYNPIDYTSIRKEVFNAPPPQAPRAPFAPLPSRLPALKKIMLSVWDEEAVANK